MTRKLVLGGVLTAVGSRRVGCLWRQRPDGDVPTCDDGAGGDDGPHDGAGGDDGARRGKGD